LAPWKSLPITNTRLQWDRSPD